MSLPSIVSYGAAAKTSTLVWDSDLTIPDGYAIESASGEVGIVGDVSISGAITTPNANITTPVLDGKNMLNFVLTLAKPISVTSTAKSFTVNNPYPVPISVTISSTASPTNDAGNPVYFDGSVIFYVPVGGSKSQNLDMSPGNHTISQYYSDSITVYGDIISFYAFA